MDTIILEEIANEFLVGGTKEKCIEKKRELYSLSWALNRYLERTDFMNLCTRLLKSTKLSDSYIKLI